MSKRKGSVLITRDIPAIGGILLVLIVVFGGALAGAAAKEAKDSSSETLAAFQAGRTIVCMDIWDYFSHFVGIYRV